MCDVLSCSSIEDLYPLLHTLQPERTISVGTYGTLDDPADMRTGIWHVSSGKISLAVPELRPTEREPGIGDSADYRPSWIGHTEPSRQWTYKKWADGRERLSGDWLEISTIQERATIEAAVPASRKLASDSLGG